MKPLYHTIYPPNPWGHGGEKRTAQLAEILSDNKIECIYPIYDDKWSIKSIVKIIITIGSIFGFFRLKSIKSFLKFLITFATQISSIDKFLHQDANLLIWESTKDIYYYLPGWAKRHHKKVIALPHNLESLVPGQKSMMTGKFSPFGFDYEIKALKSCDAVFAISREETLMLKLFGVNAHYFPYYPPREVEQHLLSIRKKREKRDKNSKKQILLMGSAINPPTRSGMESRISFFEQNKIENVELRVGGYGTELLENKISNTKDIKLLGELTNEELEAELMQADALLIHQPPTTGALTRIIEMLIAGVPVIVNEDSARSYWGYEGVIVYENDEQLIDILNHYLDIPCLPKNPNYNLFIETIKLLNR